MRIAKAISAAGICSRRNAEKLILEYRVKINGAIINSPAINVSDHDEIIIDDKLLNRDNPLRIWLYHKPPGLITTYHDPQNRPTIFQQLPSNMPKVISVGRLDMQSEGLLILTNSGEFARQMELPSNNITRIYMVHIFGKLIIENMKKVENGITINGEFFRPKKIELISSKSMNHILKITLTEGKNREIRKIMDHFKLKIKKLQRIEYGEFKLNSLKPGEILEIKQ